MKKNNVLLVVLAHPDDESFGMGGTLAKYAAQGIDVHLLCATKGEVGDVSPEKMTGYATIADLREAELRCAADFLGLKKVHFLGYRDSGMSGTADNHHPLSLASRSIEEISNKIVGYIRELKPSVIITFDPIGGYRHPDHIAIHNATVLAFKQAGENKIITDGLEPFQPEKLYYHTFPKKILRTGVKLLKLFGKDPKKIGRNNDIDLESFANENFPIHTVIDIKNFRKQKDLAGSCHASQGGGRFGGGLFNYFFRLLDTKESFMQAYPVIESKRPVSHDFFG